MTISEAKNDIKDIEQFRNSVCMSCTANDWFCPSYCNILEKAERIDFNKILKSYARNDGDIWKVIRYIHRYKEIENNG